MVVYTWSPARCEAEIQDYGFKDSLSYILRLCHQSVSKDVMHRLYWWCCVQGSLEEQSQWSVNML